MFNLPFNYQTFFSYNCAEFPLIKKQPSAKCENLHLLLSCCKNVKDKRFYALFNAQRLQVYSNNTEIQ